MQISLRLFLLSFTAIFVGAMLSGQRKPPQKPADRNTQAAATRGVEQVEFAAAEKEPGQQGEPKKLIQFAETGKLRPATVDSNVLPAAYTEASGKRKYSNQEVAERVARALRGAKLSGYEIDIDAKDGVVVLEGKVSSAEQRIATEEATSRVAGVTRVVNRLRVADRFDLEKMLQQRPPDSPTLLPEESDRDDTLPEIPGPRDITPPRLSAPKSEADWVPTFSPTSFVKQVTLTGNYSVPEWVLRLQMATKTKTPWLSEGIFISQLADEDESTLKQYYHDLGYFDTQVKHHITLSDGDAAASVEFVITEGRRSKVRNIEFLGNTTIADSQLRESLQLRPGDPYDQRVVNADKAKLVARYRKIGLRSASVEPRTRRVEESDHVDVVYEIREERNLSKIANPESLRDISRLAFSGVRSFDVADIRQVLEIDFDLIAAARPEISLEQYLETVRTTIESGYRHGGFPDAIVEANYRPAHIAVRVQEGRRCRCGDVQVKGTHAVSPDVLIRAVIEDSKPTRIRWKKGSPVPFDGETEKEIRKLLEVAFEEAGFFRPDFEIKIETRTDSDSASLAVTVYDEGPRAVVGRFHITGLNRNSEAEVLKFLEVESGMPFDRKLPSLLERRLAETGRFLSATVKTGNAAEDSRSNRQSRDLEIALREYDEVPPLGAALSGAEESLLKLRAWLQRWARGEIDEDIVVSGQAPFMLMNEIWKCFGRGLYSDQSAPPPDLLNSRLALEMIIAPTRGQTVSLKQIRPDGTSVMETVFAAYPDRLVLASPQRKAKLVLPNSNTDRLCLNIGGQAASRVDSDGPFRLNMGTGWSSRSVPDPSPFEVKLEFSAVFMLGLAHYDDMHCVLRDGTHHIGNNDFELQIDAATGRPVEYRLKPDTGDGMVVRARKQALKTELARLEEPLAQSVASYDSASPWKVRLDFAIDELLFAAERSHLQDGIESLRALHKLIHLWSPPALAELFEPAFRSLPEQDDAFRLPTQRAGWTIGTILEPGSQSRRLLIGRSILPVYRRFVPPTGALWPVGRDLALQWGAHHVTPGERLWTPELAVKVSPVALLTMQLLDQHLNRLLSPFVSRESLQCLELAAIGHGCEPFLTGDSWSSQWILSLATALRGLDESEQARVLAIFISDDELREALGNSLALLRTSPDEPVQKSVPRAIDQFWISVLQSKVLNESTSQGGQVLPAAYYLDDDLKNFLPGPEFKLSKQVQAIEEYKRRQQSKAPPEE